MGVSDGTIGEFFDYVVYGRPVSTQRISRGSGLEPKKPSNLPKWRETIREAIEVEWASYSGEVFIDPLRLDLLWVYDARVPNAPDVDNIVKPFIDLLQARLYGEDKAFEEMHLFKRALGMNRLEDLQAEKLDEAYESNSEFVYVRITRITRTRQP
jgi:Holliday junction resolvase RusA-like endonuclease